MAYDYDGKNGSVYEDNCGESRKSTPHVESGTFMVASEEGERVSCRVVPQLEPICDSRWLRLPVMGSGWSHET